MQKFTNKYNLILKKMANNNELVSRLREILGVAYYEENQYQIHEDFCDRVDELVELINNMESSTIKKNIISILDEKLYPNLPFGEWDSYEKINSVIAKTLKSLCDYLNFETEK